MAIRTGKTLRGVALAGAAIAAGAGVLAPGAPAAAATTADDSIIIGITLPWELSYGDGTASGTFLIAQPPLGIGRTITVKGVVTSQVASSCYAVRYTVGSAVTDSPASCGPTQPASFSFTSTQYIPITPITLTLCKAPAIGAVADCGPVKQLA